MSCRVIKNIRDRISKTKRLSVFILDNWECVYCGMAVSRHDGPVRSRTIDHLSPVSDMIGLPVAIINSISNLVTAHARCNRNQGGLPVEKKNPKYGRFRQQGQKET